MPIDNRTANLNLPLPDQGNTLNDDVLRIIAAFQSVDVAIAGKATPADIAAAVAALVNSSPAALDTLKELATALGNDANFAATLTAALGLKAPISNPTFTGQVGGITAAMVGAPAGSGNSSGTNTGDQDLSVKQNILVSGTNIKTVGGVSILGSGNITAGTQSTHTTPAQHCAPCPPPTVMPLLSKAWACLHGSLPAQSLMMTSLPLPLQAVSGLCAPQAGM